MTEPDILNAFRAAALDIEATVLEHGGLAGKDTEKLCPVRHFFGEGCYVREWNSPAGNFVLSKIHKVAHPFFVLKGEGSVLTEDGLQLIEAPYHGITPAGTKRILYTHSETQWVTVHVTDETDVDKIEDEIIAKGFDDPRIQAADAAKFKEVGP